MYRYKAEGGLRPEFQSEGWLAGAYVMVSKLAECGLSALSPSLVQQGAALEAWLIEKLGGALGSKARDCAAGRWLLQQAGFKDYVGLFTSEAQPILRDLTRRLAEDLEQNLPTRPDASAGALLLPTLKCHKITQPDFSPLILHASSLRELPLCFVQALHCG